MTQSKETLLSAIKALGGGDISTNVNGLVSILGAASGAFSLGISAILMSLAYLYKEKGISVMTDELFHIQFVVKGVVSGVADIANVNALSGMNLSIFNIFLSFT